MRWCFPLWGYKSLYSSILGLSPDVEIVVSHGNICARLSDEAIMRHREVIDLSKLCINLCFCSLMLYCISALED